jgi:hypothetical protein
MSWNFDMIPQDCLECQADLELIIVPRTVDIGGFEVHRALPSKKRQMVLRTAQYSGM